MGNTNDNKTALSLPFLGIGLVAGWFLRKMLQQKFQEIEPEKSSRTLTDKEMIETVFGEYSAQARRFVSEARSELDTRLESLQTTLEDVDKQKYVDLVRDVVERVGKEGRMSARQMTQLQDYLVDDFEQVRSAAVEKQTKTRSTRKSTRTPKKQA